VSDSTTAVAGLVLRTTVAVAAATEAGAAATAAAIRPLGAVARDMPDFTTLRK